MKKFLSILALILALLLPLPVLGCGEGGEDDTINVVCTIFPQYDWARNIAAGGDKVSLTLIQNSGVDLHNYQATAADKVKILNADLLIYVGGESDKWVEDILQGSSADMKIIRLLDEIDALDEEDAPGAEEDESHEHEEAGVKDEHVWLSLKRAQTLVQSITKALQELDKENDVLYENNMHAYLEKLSTLEKEYEDAVNGAKNKVLVFCDRFPFRYLVEDYNLEYYAAFNGCSAEAEVSFSTVINLAKALDEHDLSYVLVLESSDKKIANQVIEQTQKKDMQILVINSIQSVNESQASSGTDYLALMRENLTALKTALN